MARKKEYGGFIARALDLGAAGAGIIDAHTIATAAWVRQKCQFGCGGYNSNYCCPPYSPTPEETRKVIDCYEKAMLVHFTAPGGRTKTIVALEREIFLSGYYKALGFGSGPCRLCKTCLEGRCKHPEKARPSMEACGIDVYTTARANGFPIEVVKKRTDAVNYYGLVLVE